MASIPPVPGSTPPLPHLPLPSPSGQRLNAVATRVTSQARALFHPGPVNASAVTALGSSSSSPLNTAPPAQANSSPTTFQPSQAPFHSSSSAQPIHGTPQTAISPPPLNPNSQETASIVQAQATSATPAKKTAKVAALIIQTEESEAISLSGRFLKEAILATLADQKQFFKDTIRATEKTIQDVDQQCKSLKQRIAVLQGKLSRQEGLKEARETMLSELRENLAKLNTLSLPKSSSSSSSQRNFVELEPSLPQSSISHPAKVPTQKISPEEIHLLAQIYNPELVKGYKGKVLYRGEGEKELKEVQIMGSENGVFLLSQDGTLKASDNELAFCPEQGNEYLAKLTERTKIDKYFPATVREVKLLSSPGKRKITCFLQWKGKKEKNRKFLARLQDILPFGPSHKQAKRLKTDRDGYYYLKENKSEPSSKRAKTS